MYSVYLRWHDDVRPIEHQTRTGDWDQAVAAFRALLGRRELDGERAAVVLRDQRRARTLLFSRFDIADQRMMPGDPIPPPDHDWGQADVTTRAIVTARAAPAVSDASWSALLKRWRGRRGMTGAEAAAALGVPYSTLVGWEVGKPAGNAGAVGRVLLLELDGPME